MEGMTSAFYGDLLTAMLGNDEEYVKELLGKLGEDELQDLAGACGALARLARETWYNLPEPEKEDKWTSQ